MNVSARLGAMSLAVAVLAGTAQSAVYFHSVKEPVVVKECGGCHMGYPPALLPARSWAKMIGELGHHFGDDASLPEAARAKILDFYIRNAGDAGHSGYTDAGFMRGVQAGVTPERITDMPFWHSIHDRYPLAAFTRPQVKRIGNCIACHG